ncbi:hypothetical protein AAC387_Pa11g0535 [Persea americana]
MGTASTNSTSLRQLLRSLCHNTQWNYAIYWKLKHRTRILLTWEDGYCDYHQPRNSEQHLLESFCFNDTSRSISFDQEINTHEGSSEAYSIGLAVANMSCLTYALGEGAVGKVALTGKHSWVCSHEFNSKLVPKCPDEWHLQFAFGVKTILLVPVVPHGVVQLGSIELVTEDLKLVADIKGLFNTLQDVAENSVFFTLSVKQETLMKKDVKVPDVGQITGNEPSTISTQFSSHVTVQNKFQVSQKRKKHILGGHTMDGNDIPGFDCLEEELLFSQYTAVNPQQSAMQSMTLNYSDNNVEKNNHDIYMNSSAGYGFYSGHMVDEQFEFVASEEISHEIAHSLLNFPADSELHKAVWPAFREHCLSDPTLSKYDRCNGLSPIDQTDSTWDNEPSFWESVGWFVNGGTGEHLLDAVVGNGASEERALDTATNIASPSQSSGQLATSCQTHCRSSGGVLTDDMCPRSYVKSASATRSGDVFTSSPSGSSSRATSILIDEAPRKIEMKDVRSRRVTKSYQFSNRKPRTSGDIQKPRPRDRQMIQDRVKELREIVPNGSKCSIDALLDRTIKHMLFLQKVTSQAEKLKQCVNSKVIGNENWNGSASQTQQINASWAFELGSKPGVYPIIVENLDQPGHMLVEMPCEEHGFFLEIAQVIRNLELTILKGVMEKRSDKTWAHFIVEVSRGFQRMDILWPLMQLLQQNRNTISSKF